jgi:nitroimidazol reductase NimA-like FMN-containing flavoprotein (pyridoxamine 5'-phosphate oxidase superfamily)
MVPDENRAMKQRKLEDLLPDECFRLLAAADVGRFVYQDDLGPLAVPVNYAMAGHDIVFRVERGAKQTAAMQQPMIAFEVDHIDEDRHSGWSVLVRGVADEVKEERLPALLHTMEDVPMPWACGHHSVWLQLVPHTVTGRRLGAEWSMLELGIR